MSKQYVLQREVSDHYALVVKSVEKDWGPKPFRTIDAWLLERGFSRMVKDKWQSYSVQGNVITKLKEKLKLHKYDLKSWNMEVFGNLDTTKRRILQELEVQDSQDCIGGLEETERLKRLELVSRLKVNDKKLESLSCQKARASLFKNEDSCTRFYHSSLKWRRLRNEVKGVQVGDQWCEEPSTVCQEAKKLFEARFKATKDLGVRLDGVKFKSITPFANESLLAEFSEEEIRDAVWQCEGFKSSGPDGFNFNFIRKSWDFIKDEIMAALSLFHKTGSIPKGRNAFFIALVPKVRDPSELEQYRPISLVGALYKIISKVLASRMKKVLPSIINESQSAFVKGRGILDSVFLANEVAEDLRRNGRIGLCLKVDFEKAYDSVRWEFLYNMLLRMGFHNLWITWIRGCLESTSVSVLVNGSPTEEFKPTRGLKRGDPLVPFLFLVVAEVLGGIVRQARKTNLLTGLKIGRKEIEVCILQFTDDTIFLCEDSLNNVVTLKVILRGFELASSLKINFHKSKLAGINVQSNVFACYTKTLNCTQMGISFKYLGLEVGKNPRKKQFWEPVINKIKARLSVWKGRFLTMAGRICLINSVITAILLYYLSLFRAPDPLYKRITSIQRRFLWGWGSVNKSISWISWKDVCRPREEGGLGLREIHKFNHALLAKWIWCYISQEVGRWKEILDSKYGLELESAQTSVKLHSWWWRDLSKVCKKGGGK